MLIINESIKRRNTSIHVLCFIEEDFPSLQLTWNSVCSWTLGHNHLRFIVSTSAPKCCDYSWVTPHASARTHIPIGPVQGNQGIPAISSIWKCPPSASSFNQSRPCTVKLPLFLYTFIHQALDWEPVMHMQNIHKAKNKHNSSLYIQSLWHWTGTTRASQEGVCYLKQILSFVINSSFNLVLAERLVS